MLAMKRRAGHAAVLGMAALALGMLIALSAPSPANAQGETVIEVNTFEDTLKFNDGACSLREAIISANSNRAPKRSPASAPREAHDDTILLPPGRYVMSRSDSGQEGSATTGDFDLASDMTVAAAGPGLVVIDGGDVSDRVFHVLRSQHDAARRERRGRQCQRAGRRRAGRRQRIAHRRQRHVHGQPGNGRSRRRALRSGCGGPYQRHHHGQQRFRAAAPSAAPAASPCAIPLSPAAVAARRSPPRARISSSTRTAASARPRAATRC